jgi:LmbE family N-acetylglucosaminyl deacetylase
MLDEVSKSGGKAGSPAGQPRWGAKPTFLECGGKRSATPLSIDYQKRKRRRRSSAFLSNTEKSIMKLRATYKSLSSIICTLALLSSLLATTTRAQQAAPSPASANQPINIADLHQALVDLNNTWTVMCVAAHPDDEDGTTLTVLRRRDGAHTVSLFSTYGEGGQNAVGPELYEELGVIRAAETMKAAKIQGSEPYFLGLKDFGFSKSADEAFKFWGHDEALRRMVRKIRELRPDVIITNHDTTSGHGHHQATGRLIIEAFDAAADPKRFPEQLDQVKPWQAQRLFVRVFGGANAQQPAGESGKLFSVDPNEVDPVRGISFAEQALKALQQHATQGPWPSSIKDLMRARRIETGKMPLIRYRLVREAAGVPPLPQDAVTPLAGLVLPATLVPDITPPSIEGRPLSTFLDRPDKILAVLIGWRASRGLRALPTGDPERFALFESRSDLAIATGVSLTLSSPAPVLVPGVESAFSLVLGNPSMRAVHVEDLKFNDGAEPKRLDTADLLLPDTETIVTVDSAVPKNSGVTVPLEDHLYDGLFLGKRFEAAALVDVDGAKFSVRTELRLPVVPAVEIQNISPSPCVRTEEMLGRCDGFKVTVVNHQATPFRGTMVMDAHAVPNRGAVYQLVLGPNEKREDSLVIHDPKGARQTLKELRRSGSMEFSIMAADSTEVITKRTAPVVYSNARVSQNLRVGYVPSFDQTLELSLAALGVPSKALTVDDIKSADLSAYSTIIIDNRGYEAHPELIAANSRLLDFAQAGGTLIVFYHKDNEWNPDEKKNRPQLAPYPIILDDKRVTDETAPITFLQPRHPLLNSPNRITPADFANWIQERGLYYPKQWDAHYTELFSTHDPGEPPLIGGLLAAPYGKGHYIYTSMVWYRELRAGVPGAYRVFANMISYGHK